MRTEQLLVGSAQATTTVRRSNHGGVAWTPADPQENLHQPQDGALQRTPATVFAALTKKTMLREPEDARLTGGTRSLMRRVMGLNVTAPRKAGPKPVSATAAIQAA